MKPKLIFIVGATAVGKTEVALILAKKINAEIISCDSMQVYKGMDIITSKPSSACRRNIRHHLIDILNPVYEYDASQYCRDAAKKIKEIVKRGKIPIVVGGAGLYMSLLIDGLFKDKASNKNTRNRLYKEAEIYGSRYLYEKLKNLDSEAAFKIHPNDIKRIIRALEVIEATGKPISYLQKQRKGLFDKYDIQIFCLALPRNNLYQRIEERVERMFDSGLINEVKQLLKLRLSKTASYAIGIKELKGNFNGLYDINEAKRLMVRNTCLYAKRQLTWFRKDKRIEWIKIDSDDTPKDIALRLWNVLY